MKQLFSFFLLGMFFFPFVAHASSLPEKQDTVVVVDDSLDCYRYHVSQMTLLVKDKPVHYTVVFDTVKNYLSPQYYQIGGTVYPYSAIRSYGEKYRKGILVYEKESEENHE